ncbi:MAG: hypothetical protein V4616_14795 [Bacteroidota bacterium]
MIEIYHKLHSYQPDPETRILIIGTWLPDRTDSPDFFYGWNKSFLWHLLPISFGRESLKDATLLEKKDFMKEFKVDFTDVISSLSVEEKDQNVADDSFVDASVEKWTDLIALIDSLPKLEAVYFTRKTFNGLPNIRVKVVEAAKHCLDKNIRFCKLDTPSKYFDPGKQQQWRDTIVTGKTCLRV